MTRNRLPGPRLQYKDQRIYGYDFRFQDEPEPDHETVILSVLLGIALGSATLLIGWGWLVELVR